MKEIRLASIALAAYFTSSAVCGFMKSIGRLTRASGA